MSNAVVFHIFPETTAISTSDANCKSFDNVKVFWIDGFMDNEIVPAKTGDIVIYQGTQGTEVECVFHGENMWLTQAHMVELYGITKKDNQRAYS